MAHELTFEEIQLCKKVFDNLKLSEIISIDEARINLVDLRLAIEGLSFKMEDKELDEIQVNMNLGTEINFPTFLRIAAIKFKQHEFSKALGDAFKCFDKTNKGYLTYEELRDIIVDNGPKKSRIQAEALLTELGLQQNEKFIYDEFVQNKI